VWAGGIYRSGRLRESVKLFSRALCFTPTEKATMAAGASAAVTAAAVAAATEKVKVEQSK